MSSRSLLASTILACASGLVLTSCSSGDDSSQPATVTQTVTASPTPAPTSTPTTESTIKSTKKSQPARVTEGLASVQETPTQSRLPKNHEVQSPVSLRPPNIGASHGLPPKPNIPSTPQQQKPATQAPPPPFPASENREWVQLGPFDSAAACNSRNASWPEAKSECFTTTKGVFFWGLRQANVPSSNSRPGQSPPGSAAQSGPYGSPWTCEQAAYAEGRTNKCYKGPDGYYFSR